MALSTVRRRWHYHGLFILESFSVAVELVLFYDIRFSTGGTAGMSFCNLAFVSAFYPFLYHLLVGSLFNYNSSILDNRIIRLKVRSLIAVWIWTCLCIVNCTQFPVGHFMDVDLNRCLFSMVISFVLQAFVRVCRELQTASVENFLHCSAIASMKGFIVQIMQFGHVFTLLEQFGHYGVIISVNGCIAQGMQSCYVFLPWSLASPQLGTECVPWLLTRSKILTIANHHMVGYESREFRCLAFLLCGIGFCVDVLPQLHPFGTYYNSRSDLVVL